MTEKQPDNSTRWAIVSPTGLIINGCIRNTRKEAVQRLVDDYPKKLGWDWDHFRKQGYRAVKIKFVVLT